MRREEAKGDDSEGVRREKKKKKQNKTKGGEKVREIIVRNAK